MISLPETKILEKRYQEYTQQIQAHYKKLESELESMINEYQANEKTMPQSSKELYKKEIQDKQRRIAEYELDAQQDLMSYRQELYKPLIDSIQEVIRSVAKEKGYTYVFDTSAGNPIYFDSSHDLMGDVRKRLGLQ